MVYIFCLLKEKSYSTVVQKYLHQNEVGLNNFCIFDFTFQFFFNVINLVYHIIHLIENTIKQIF